MTRNIVRVSFGILLVFGLSLSISIDHRVLSKTDSSLGALGTAVSSTPFNLNTKSESLPATEPFPNKGISQSSHKTRSYLATSITSQTFTLNTIISKTDSVPPSPPINSNPSGSATSRNFSVNTADQ